MKLGIIQSRGLGDILIALPIALNYKEQGYDIYWPVCDSFYPSVVDHVPWVNWISIPTDPKGHFFYIEPNRLLTELGCDDILCLYQALNVVPELSQVPWFQIQHFDEFKYTKAGVPFLDKWRLNECITRNPQKEQELYDLLITSPEYLVYHTEGSTYKCEADLSQIPTTWQRLEIKPQQGYSVFDWLKILEGAEALILIDSVFSNLVDQLRIKTDKYWIPRSHIHLTPVLGETWTILDAPSDSLAAQQIFRPG